MSNATDIRGLDKAIRERIAKIEDLRHLPFDSPDYEAWRVDTGRLLDRLYGEIESEQHPCTRAFLNYRIPIDFTATHSEMQDYYLSILEQQKDLLRLYLDDIEHSHDR